MITAADFTALKERVKAECARRKYTGSVASYAGTAYDYSYPAAAGTIVRYEHYTKIAEPLTAIDGKVRTPRTRINQADITEMDTALTALEKISLRATNTGCAASCTGLCSTACSGSCSGTCRGSCGDDCGYDCTGGCDGSCGTSCATDCTTTCTGRCYGCGNVCGTECADSCYAGEW